MSPLSVGTPGVIQTIVERSSDKRMKEYWLTIYPHCFLWLKEEEGLVYNTQSYASVRFRNEGLLAEKAKQLAIMENLYCILLTEEELADEKLNFAMLEIHKNRIIRMGH